MHIRRTETGPAKIDYSSAVIMGQKGTLHHPSTTASFSNGETEDQRGEITY
jgi:hypothetical protein